MLEKGNLYEVEEIKNELVETCNKLLEEVCENSLKLIKTEKSFNTFVLAYSTTLSAYVNLLGTIEEDDKFIKNNLIKPSMNRFDETAVKLFKKLENNKNKGEK